MKKTLSIKDEKAAELAHDVARMMGQTMTKVVVEALEDKQAKEMRRRERKVAATVEAGLAIARQCAALPVYDARTPDEILGYDEHGLPT